MGKLVDLEMIYIMGTDRAVGVKADEEAEMIWLPRSQVECDADIIGDVCEVTMPEWLAKEKGLI